MRSRHLPLLAVLIPCRNAGRRVLISICLTGGLFVGGCSELEGTGEARTIKYSGGEYNRGYRDGMREAKVSLMDQHAGWMWLWIMDEEYAQGYDRGWQDGRATLDLERQKAASDHRGDRDALSNEEE